MHDCGQTQAEKRSIFRRACAVVWTEIKWRTYLLYCRTLYRPHMRWLHRRGKHWHKKLHPLGGPEIHWCEWCGDRYTVDRGEARFGQFTNVMPVIKDDGAGLTIKTTAERVRGL